MTIEALFFLAGAAGMLAMYVRQTGQRKKLTRSGRKVTARVAGLTQTREGSAYILTFETESGQHRLQYPHPAKGDPLRTGQEVTLYFDPLEPARLFVAEDPSVKNTERFYLILSVLLAVLFVVLQFAVG